MLSDGTELHFPPHLAAALVFTARPGDAVTVQGRRHKGGPVLEANEIRNQASGVAVANSGPKHARDEAKPGQVTGKVQYTLHGPKGEVNGAILQDGTVLRLPAPRSRAVGVGAGGHGGRPGPGDADGQGGGGEEAGPGPNAS